MSQVEVLPTLANIALKDPANDYQNYHRSRDGGIYQCPRAVKSDSILTQNNSIEIEAALRVPRRGATHFDPKRLSIQHSPEHDLDSKLATTSIPNTVKASVDAGQRHLTSKWSLSRKPTRLQIFDDIELSTEVFARFNDLCELYEEQLYKCVFKNATRHTPISIKLKVLGQKRTSAEPWAVVLCDKTVFKKVKDFFNQSLVKNDFAGKSGGMPVIRVLPCPRPPISYANDMPEVFVDGDDLADCRTLCGMTIMVGQDINSRTVKCGGIIKASFGNGLGYHLYAMTAGHVFQNDLDSSNRTGTEPLDDPDTSDSEMDSSDEDEYELDITTSDSIEKPYGSHNNLPDDENLYTSYASASCDFGQLNKLGAHTTANGQDSDWALIQVSDGIFRRTSAQNKFQSQYRGFKEIIDYVPDELPDGTETEIFLARAASGPQAGILRSRSSRLMAGPATSFTKVYDLVTPEKFKVGPGDSGTWVIDGTTTRLLGHIIAGDIFGDVYVVPVDTTFNQMRWATKADSISLPRAWDFPGSGRQLLKMSETSFSFREGLGELFKLQRQLASFSESLESFQRLIELTSNWMYLPLHATVNSLKSSIPGAWRKLETLLRYLDILYALLETWDEQLLPSFHTVGVVSKCMSTLKAFLEFWAKTLSEPMMMLHAISNEKRKNITLSRVQIFESISRRLTLLAPFLVRRQPLQETFEFRVEAENPLNVLREISEELRTAMAWVETRDSSLHSGTNRLRPNPLELRRLGSSGGSFSPSIPRVRFMEKLYQSRASISQPSIASGSILKTQHGQKPLHVKRKDDEIEVSPNPWLPKSGTPSYTRPDDFGSDSGSFSSAYTPGSLFSSNAPSSITSGSTSSSVASYFNAGSADSSCTSGSIISDRYSYPKPPIDFSTSSLREKALLSPRKSEEPRPEPKNQDLFSDSDFNAW